MSNGLSIPKPRVIKTAANMTPMIDIVFLLIVFFVLISRISEVELIPMDLPEPRNPAASTPSDQARAVVNLPGSKDGALQELRLNAESWSATPNGMLSFSNSLAQLLIQNPDLEVTLRADRRLPYTTVQEVMNGISAAGDQAGIEDRVRMNLVIVNSSTAKGEAQDDE